MTLPKIAIGIFIALMTTMAWGNIPDFPPTSATSHSLISWCVLASFCVILLFLISEEFSGLRKSKPVVLGAGAIWIMLAITWSADPMTADQINIVHAYLLSSIELILFILVAMAYANALEERQAFAALHSWLNARQFSYRQAFWITGLIGFLLSPLLGNLATPLLLLPVIIAIAKGQSRFIILGSTNLIVAINAGGVFSPFGNISSLLLWQNENLTLTELAHLFMPSIVSFVVPALIMSFFVPAGRLQSATRIKPRRGTKRIITCYLLTLLTTILFTSVLHLPSVIGMLTGFSYLMLLGYYLRRTHSDWQSRHPEKALDVEYLSSFDVFNSIAKADWDTLFYIYGIFMCISGVALCGWFDWLPGMLTPDNQTLFLLIIGFFAGLLDGLAVLLPALVMQPDLSVHSWQLAALAAGTGSSLFTLGAVGGIALLSKSAGYYSFKTHLKWTPVIALGWIAGILYFLWQNPI